MPSFKTHPNVASPQSGCDSAMRSRVCLAPEGCVHTLLESQSHPTLGFSHAGMHLLPALGSDTRGQEPFFPCCRAPPLPCCHLGLRPGARA